MYCCKHKLRQVGESLEDGSGGVSELLIEEDKRTHLDRGQPLDVFPSFVVCRTFSMRSSSLLTFNLENDKHIN